MYVCTFVYMYKYICMCACEWLKLHPPATVCMSNNTDKRRCLTYKYYFSVFLSFFLFVYLKNIPMEQTNGKTTNVFVIAKCALDIVVVYCCFCWCAPVKNQLVNKWDSRLSYKWGDIDTDTPSKYTIAIPLIHMRMRDHRLPGAPRVRLSALLLEFCLSVYVCVCACVFVFLFVCALKR